MPPPDRWDAYQALGCVIPGTKFIAFKVPLKQAMCNNLPEEERFSPEKLIQAIGESGKRLGLVLDLTFTRKYYNPESFTNQSIQYEKIFTKGHEVPDEGVVHRFLEVVDDFTSKTSEEDVLIGVHCTHGVNRTGYLVCRYMIERLHMDPENAMSIFGQARGHPIERPNYIQDLKMRPLNPNKGTSSEQRDNNRKTHRPTSGAHERLPTPQHPHLGSAWQGREGPGRHGFHSAWNYPQHSHHGDPPFGSRPETQLAAHPDQQGGRGHPFRGWYSPVNLLNVPSLDNQGRGRGRYHSVSGHCSPLGRIQSSEQTGWGDAAKSGWGSSVSGSRGFRNAAQQRYWHNRELRSGYHTQYQNRSWRRPGSSQSDAAPGNQGYWDRPRLEQGGDGGRCGGSRGRGGADKGRNWQQRNSSDGHTPWGSDRGPGIYRQEGSSTGEYQARKGTGYRGAHHTGGSAERRGQGYPDNQAGCSGNS